eukprot:m.9793 g.9793  ORF g.9793 m.9793 type:complete len:56 (+) comp3557_c0_seq1:748-915(+)
MLKICFFFLVVVVVLIVIIPIIHAFSIHLSTSYFNLHNPIKPMQDGYPTRYPNNY